MWHEGDELVAAIASIGWPSVAVSVCLLTIQVVVQIVGLIYHQDLPSSGPQKPHSPQMLGDQPREKEYIRVGKIRRQDSSKRLLLGLVQSLGPACLQAVEYTS